MHTTTNHNMERRLFCTCLLGAVCALALCMPATSEPGVGLEIHAKWACASCGETHVHVWLVAIPAEVPGDPYYDGCTTDDGREFAHAHHATTWPNFTLSAPAGCTAGPVTVTATMVNAYWDDQMTGYDGTEGGPTLASNCHGWAMGGEQSHTFGDLWAQDDSATRLHSDNCISTGTYVSGYKEYTAAHSKVVITVECCMEPNCTDRGPWITRTKEKVFESRIYIYNFEQHDHEDGRLGAATYFVQF